MTNVLFTTSEIYPLLKTGGLADVSASLPRSLHSLGHQVRVLVPAYGALLAAAPVTGRKRLAAFEVDGAKVALWQVRLPGTRLTVWLVDAPDFFGREGNPYVDEHGRDWPDNAARFLFFAKVAREIAMNRLGLEWRPDVVHCNDWQTGMIPALLSQEAARPATVFTIHNLAYQGLFSHDTFRSLNLPDHFWRLEALEFHGQMSFMKGGLVYSDYITTVSPSYAEEIQTPEGGNGLDGLLRHRQNHLRGILNGIDPKEWNPGSDPYLVETYTRRSLDKKLQNKQHLQKRFGLSRKATVPVLGFIGRLVEQKGVDLILSALPQLLQQGCQAIVLGSGMAEYEQALEQLKNEHPKSLAVVLGYDEELAHRIEGGADIFLMPSRFEPCGLNQMYSLRYGTVPVVRRVGGLKDTVVDAQDAGQESANGFVFHDATPDAMLQAVQRALNLYSDKARWKQLQQQGMSQDFSWQKSALAYQQVYEAAVTAAR